MRFKRKIYSKITLIAFLLTVIYFIASKSWTNDDYKEIPLQNDIIYVKKGNIYEIFRFGNIDNTNNAVTIVSIYFSFDKSKHSKEEYKIWCETFLKSISSPLVAFIDYKSLDLFNKTIREQNLTATLYVTESIWDIMRELEIYRNKSYIYNYKNEQKTLDIEKHIHYPELYSVWNLKMYLVRKVSQINPYKSDFFMFTDAGAWRVKVFKKWPDQEFIKRLAIQLEDKILFSQVNYTNKEYIQAGIFAGSSKAIDYIYNNYFLLHDIWMDIGLFVGKEQNMMNRLAFKLIPNHIVRLKTHNIKCVIEYDDWFFYQYYFANSDEYICQEDKLSLLLKTG